MRKNNIKKTNANLKKLNEKVREQKAITLIALVITIVILLILAGITIAQLTGENGLFARAKQAKQETEKAQIEENAILGDYENTINSVVGDITTIGTRNPDENTYSTDEQVIGTWINGKTIYRKVITVQNTSANEYFSVQIGASIDTPINLYGMIDSGGGDIIPICGGSDNSSQIVSAWVRNYEHEYSNTITYRTLWNNASILFVVEYTKTTDN